MPDSVGAFSGAGQFSLRRYCGVKYSNRGRLFDSNYRQANDAFLTKSLGTLRNVALAACDGAAVGFGLAERRVIGG